MEKKILVFLISSNNIEYLKNAIIEIDNMENTDLLIIDEGSDYNIAEEVSDYKSVKIISYEQPSGYGSYLSSAKQYAENFDYDYLIGIDCSSSKSISDIKNIKSNLDYGYDIVNCSRILENYDHTKIDESVLQFFEELTGYLNSIIEVSLTDPFSINVGINLKSADQLDLTENGHGALLQIFIQSQFFGYNCIEIPSEAELNLGNELELYEDPLPLFLSILETEKYLYNKGTVN